LAIESNPLDRRRGGEAPFAVLVRIDLRTLPDEKIEHVHLRAVDHRHVCRAISIRPSAVGSFYGVGALVDKVPDHRKDRDQDRAARVGVPA
jgi:hypothetical protein